MIFQGGPDPPVPPLPLDPHLFHGISFRLEQLTHMMKSMEVELKKIVLNLNQIQRI